MQKVIKGGPQPRLCLSQLEDFKEASAPVKNKEAGYIISSEQKALYTFSCQSSALHCLYK